MTDNVEMRALFEGAIKLQEEIIADSNRRIEHYRWAMAEMDKQDKIIELNKTTVSDVA